MPENMRTMVRFFTGMRISFENFDHEVPINIVPEPGNISLFLSSLATLFTFRKKLGIK